MRYITVEEHFASPAFLAGPGREFTERLRQARGARFVEQLQDLGSKRIAEMDAAGIDMQVISLNAPGVEQAEADVQVPVARETNDLLAEAVRQHPLRFGAFACLPVAAPEKAADELDLRIRQQRFKGALINGHTRGRYLDDKFFSPILERAEALNAPLYLHPTIPPKPVVDALYRGFSPAVTAMFASQWLGEDRSEIDFSEFDAQVRAHNVKSIDVHGSLAYGEFVVPLRAVHVERSELHRCHAYE